MWSDDWMPILSVGMIAHRRFAATTRHDYRWWIEGAVLAALIFHLFCAGWLVWFLLNFHLRQDVVRTRLSYSIASAYLRASLAACFLILTISDLLAAVQWRTSCSRAWDFQCVCVACANGARIETIGWKIRMPRRPSLVELIAQVAASGLRVVGFVDKFS